MKTSTKIATGIVAFSPFPLTFLTLGSFVYLVNMNPDDIVTSFNEYALPIYLFNIFLTLYFAASHIYFIVHSAQNPNLGAMRVTWIVCTIIFGPFVFPFYWYQHIWHEGKIATKSSPLGLN